MTGKPVNFISPSGEFDFGTTSGSKGVLEMDIGTLAANGSAIRLRTSGNFTGSGTLTAGILLDGTYAPTSGAGNIYAGVQVAPVINSTGTASAGTFSALRISPYLQSTTGYTSRKL